MYWYESDGFELKYMKFQQDGAPYHNYTVSISLVEETVIVMFL